MADFGIETFIGGTQFDAINSFTEDYVIDVFQVTASGSKTYPTASDYTISAYMVNSPVTYQGGGDFAQPSTVSVNGGIVSWTARGLTNIVVTMKNV